MSYALNFFNELYAHALHTYTWYRKNKTQPAYNLRVWFFMIYIIYACNIFLITFESMMLKNYAHSIRVRTYNI
jgi:hypothetical protein